MAITLSVLPTSPTFAENTVNGTPQLLYSSATFTDPDDVLDGTTLTLSGLLTEDRVTIRNEGSSAGQIGYASGIVSYEGVVIGSVAGGSGAALTVTFNGNATAAAVEALIENLTYVNTSDAPTSSRTFELTFAPFPPTVAEQTGGNNPFNGVDARFEPAPTFGDVDGDGDLDLVLESGPELMKRVPIGG